MERLQKLAHSHIKDAVYAANDGIVTTFAVVAGVVGASRVIFTARNVFLSGLEMLFVGGVAAGIAYAAGFGIKMIL